MYLNRRRHFISGNFCPVVIQFDGIILISGYMGVLDDRKNTPQEVTLVIVLVGSSIDFDYYGLLGFIIIQK